MSKVNMKKHFLTGVFATLPLFATIYVLYLIYKIIASIVKIILPIEFITKLLISINSELAKKESNVEFLVFLVSGLLFMAVVYLTGVYINKFIDRGTTKYMENIITKIPVAKSIYSIFKQMRDTLFTKETNDYQKVVLIEYPRDGIYTLGFVANEKNNVALEATEEEELYNIFIPSTPNPGNGFFIIVPKNKTIEVDYTYEEAFKLIMSAGALEPHREETNETN